MSKRQWVVTAYGLECRPYRYDIEASRLWDNEETHGWVEHMREKRWVDLPQFVQALDAARRRHTPERYAAAQLPAGA